MSKLLLIGVGIIATFMFKQAYNITPTISQKNIWIIIGIVVMVLLAIRNYFLMNQKMQPPGRRDDSLNKKLTVGVDLKLELILRTILKNEGKIEAIKRLRDETEMDLKAASEFIETLETS